MSEIVDPRGVSVTFQRGGLTEPKGMSPFFGWIDPAGDPCTVRVEAIQAVLRDARTKRMVLLLENTPHAPALEDVDAMRLMRRMGWHVAE